MTKVETMHREEKVRADTLWRERDALADECRQRDERIARLAEGAKALKAQLAEATAALATCREKLTVLSAYASGALITTRAKNNAIGIAESVLEENRALASGGKGPHQVNVTVNTVKPLEFVPEDEPARLVCTYCLADAPRWWRGFGESHV